MVARLRRFVWVLAIAGACDARPASTSAPVQSAPQTQPPSEPAPLASEGPPEPVLPTAAGVHYLERTLGTADPEAELPMIVAIHGLGDTPENFGHLFDEFPEPARLVLVQGLDARPDGGWSWFPIRARDPDVEGLAAGIDTAADKVADAIAELRKRRPTLGAPIVTGFSQGGMLSFAIAVDHPEVVGAAVPVGGWLPPPLWPKAKPKTKVPILALHGTADNAVVFERTDEAVDQLRKLGFAAELRPYEGVGHVITPEMRRDLYDRLVDHVRAAGR